MSKKYVIETPDDTRRIWIDVYGETYCYTRAKNVDDLEELTSDYINEHYSDLQDTAYQRGLEDGKAQSERGCEGCKYQTRTVFDEPCVRCSNAYKSHWKAEPKPCDIIHNGIQNWMAELNVRVGDISKILEEMKDD